MRLIKCKEINLSNNFIEYLPEYFELPNCEKLILHDNQIKYIPLQILNCRNLNDIDISNNMNIYLSPQVKRFINRINMKKQNIYTDDQNIHNSNIQNCVKQSINNLTTRMDVPAFNKDELEIFVNKTNFINEEHKLLLRNYFNDPTEHCLLLLKYEEVFWYVIQTIETDFNQNFEVKKEIYNCLNIELADSVGMCFTGKLNRLVNSLNGFSNLVHIEIPASEQISIIINKVALDLGTDYTIESHKHFIEKELKERGYTNDVIRDWVDAIE
jgi:hypothetical protein